MERPASGQSASAKANYGRDRAGVDPLGRRRLGKAAALDDLRKQLFEVELLFCLELEPSSSDFDHWLQRGALHPFRVIAELAEVNEHARLITNCLCIVAGWDCDDLPRPYLDL